MGSKYWERTQNPRNSFRPTTTIKLTNCSCLEICKHPWNYQLSTQQQQQHDLILAS
jgi:hypothetical protein